ncbi:hypothetical protein [Pedobacter sp. MW01-1-1]|uniref:hypothetical protein n=1 Tax=Pedobacter sp. MW01-1-1 TaxID=3383027 RepID=UPI003FEE5CB8
MKSAILLLVTLLAGAGITVKAQSRNDAGLQGDAGATSGFFDANVPVNFPTGATSWWHLLDVRHSNPANNYAMQFSGSFVDQNLFFRKTNNNPAQSWSKVLLETDGVAPFGGYSFGKSRALNIGYSGGNYGGIGYNIDFTQSTGVFNRPLNDFSSYLEFCQGGYKFFGGPSYSSASNVGLSGVNKDLGLLAIITKEGNMGIGISAPQEKLAVNGNIRAKEIKVETANWPDYVFEEDYKITSLQDLEKYIKANKHLPDMPSAKEVEVEGITVGDLLKKQQKTIEELTLHLINLEKENDKLKKETTQQLIEQKKQIKELHFKLNKK